MEWAALIAWVLTAGGGVVMLAIWVARGGMRQRESGRIRPPLILGHFALAATGLVLWIVYLAAARGAALPGSGRRASWPRCGNDAGARPARGTGGRNELGAPVMTSASVTFFTVATG